MPLRDGPNLVLLNYLGACCAGTLTTVGLLARAFGGLLIAVPASLLVMAAGPLTAAFLVAALWWKRGWPYARGVQLLPFLVILAWGALIFLSPVQPRSPVP